MVGDARSARTCSIASTWWKRACRRSRGAKTVGRLDLALLRAARRTTARRFPAATERLAPRRIRGRATCASWRTKWSASPRRSRRCPRAIVPGCSQRDRVRARGFAGRHRTARIPAGQRRRPSGGKPAEEDAGPNQLEQVARGAAAWALAPGLAQGRSSATASSGTPHSRKRTGRDNSRVPALPCRRCRRQNPHCDRGRRTRRPGGPYSRLSAPTPTSSWWPSSTKTR